MVKSTKIDGRIFMYCCRKCDIDICQSCFQFISNVHDICQFIDNLKHLLQFYGYVLDRERARLQYN